MPSLTCFNVRFTPNWLMIILTSLFIALFIALGCWQIQRANEKKLLMATQQSFAKQLPASWTSTQKAPLPYQPIKIEGYYLDSIFLYDNQHYQHQFGYDVLSPLLLKDGSVVIIDRGWVSGERTRRELPEIETPKALVQIQGNTYFPSKKQWVLGAEVEEKTNKLFILERLDTKKLSQILQKRVHPFIMRLDKQNAYGFVREWAIVSMPPQRHLAYALQWFVMALVILIIFIALNLKKTNEKTLV